MAGLIGSHSREFLGQEVSGSVGRYTGEIVQAWQDELNRPPE